MCALQPIIHSSLTPLQASPLPIPELLSTPKWSDSTSKLDAHSLAQIDDLKKNTQTFLTQKVKSRKVAIFYEKKTNEKKHKLKLRKETQSNLPRHKKRLSRRELSSLIRERRQSLGNCKPPLNLDRCTVNNTISNCESQTIVPTHRCVKDEGKTLYRKEDRFCMNKFNFKFPGPNETRFDSAIAECTFNSSSGCYNNPSMDLICKNQTYFLAGQVEDPCACLGYVHPCPDAESTFSTSISPISTSSPRLPTCPPKETFSIDTLPHTIGTAISILLAIIFKIFGLYHCISNRRLRAKLARLHDAEVRNQGNIPLNDLEREYT